MCKIFDMSAFDVTDGALYTLALSIKKLKENVYRLISRQAINTLKYYKWNTSISLYFTEMMNFPDKEKDIYATLLKYLSLKTQIPIDNIKAIFVDTSSKISNNVCEIPNMNVDDNGHQKITIEIGTIVMHIPMNMYTRISSNKAELRDAVLRYSILGPTSSMFWSLYSELYTGLVKSSSYPSLECFASPFNFNINNFCSAFDQDKNLGYNSEVKCNGNFFTYINEINEPMNFIANPPYTDRVIDKTVSVLMEHFSKYPMSHLILALPDWESNSISMISSMKGSVMKVLKFGEFVLYDFFTHKLFKPEGTNMKFVVNIGQDLERSEAMMDSIVSYMSQLSQKYLS